MAAGAALLGEAAACLMNELNRDQPEKDAGQPLAAAVRSLEPDGRRKDVRRIQPLLELRPNVFPLGGTVQVCTRYAQQKRARQPSRCLIRRRCWARRAKKKLTFSCACSNACARC